MGLKSLLLINVQVIAMRQLEAKIYLLLSSIQIIIQPWGKVIDFQIKSAAPVFWKMLSSIHVWIINDNFTAGCDEHGRRQFHDSWLHDLWESAGDMKAFFWDGAKMKLKVFLKNKHCSICSDNTFPNGRNNTRLGYISVQNENFFLHFSTFKF